MIQERLAALRSLMERDHIDAYMVPTDDFHCSEYVGEYFKCRKFITGFTGSAGTAVITPDRAGLWTDGRYFIQAAKQLEGTGVTLYKMGEEGVPEIEDFLYDLLSEGQCLGFDGRTMTAGKGAALAKKLAKKNVSVSCHMDLIGEIWDDRPKLSAEPVWRPDLKYVGKPASEKCADVRKAMAEKKADYLLLTSLDDIAWLLNIRGNDVLNNPVVLSYLLMTQDRIELFSHVDTFPEELKKALSSEGVSLYPYEDIYTRVPKLPGNHSIMIDSSSVNYTLRQSIPDSMTVIEDVNPTKLPKAIKNSVEVANEKKAHITDGVAVTRFICWLKQNVGKTEITELSAASKLEEFRREGKNYLGPSFNPIISYGPHAAIVHYSATPETDCALKPEGLLLADTGGQYLEGTTDITRTIALGKTTDKEKKFFTTVLRGNLNLGNAKFLHGCTGLNLDYIARSPLWEIGEDYNHGTGHGVGFLLNVHEGPQSFRWKLPFSPVPPTVLEEGMITSNEPGYYLEGAFGIRHENLIVCRKGPKNAHGQFMEFETLTMVPFDLDAILPELLNEQERHLLNAYHKKVYETISPFLSAEEKDWLKTATREI